MKGNSLPYTRDDRATRLQGLAASNDRAKSRRDLTGQKGKARFTHERNKPRGSSAVFITPCLDNLMDRASSVHDRYPQREEQGELLQTTFLGDNSRQCQQGLSRFPTFIKTQRSFHSMASLDNLIDRAIKPQRKSSFHSKACFDSLIEKASSAHDRYPQRQSEENCCKRRP